MKKSEIKIIVELDKEQIPENIYWKAEDHASSELSKTKSVSLSFWDHKQKNTMRIDLWTKDMPINEMKKFYIDCLGGLSQSILSATNDEWMGGEISDLCDRLIERLKSES